MDFIHRQCIRWILSLPDLLWADPATREQSASGLLEAKGKGKGAGVGGGGIGRGPDGSGSGNVSGNGVKSLVDAFARLLKRHGHRCIKEAELRQADWGTDPTPLVRLLQSTTRAQLPRGKDGKAGKGGKGVKGVKGAKSGDKGGKRGKSGGTAAAAGGNHQGRGKPGSKLKAVFALQAFHRAAVAPGAAWPMTPSWPTAPMGAGQRPGRDTTLNKEADP